MAKRRSARLQKATAAPSPSALVQTASASHLPSLHEQNEPATAITTPEKPHMAGSSAITTRTPHNRTSIRPSGPDMHPHHHQASTAKLLEEARWLGFHAKGAHTAPAKGGHELANAQSTPTRGKPVINPFSTPTFQFRHKRPSVDLSPEEQRMMAESHVEAEAIRSQLFTRREAPAITVPSTRKIATPKGKASRFSDIHMAQFKKMDSIASHPSLLRADASRFSSAKTSLKRSPSKAELDINGAPPNQALSPKRRILSRPEANIPESELSFVEPMIQTGPTHIRKKSGPTKRIKRHVDDDASGTCIASQDLQGSNPVTPRRPVHYISGSAIPQFASRLMTPTKASLARSQSVKATKTSIMPYLLRSPPTRTPKAARSLEDSLKEGMRKTSNSLLNIPGVKSILRTPNRKFSADPMKIAAGTHMSPPPGLDLDAGRSRVAATAPIQKHVNFTASAVARDEQTGTPSRKIAKRAASEVSQPSTVAYPTLPNAEDLDIACTPSLRRLALDDMTGSIPGSFTFRSDMAVKFASTGTIRHVGDNYLCESAEEEGPLRAKKRKLDMVDEEFGKENKSEGDYRASKKSRHSVHDGLKTPLSKLPRRRDKRTGSLTPARLKLLAAPKRRNG